VSQTSIGARLLLTERDALLPVLRAAAPADFDHSTVLPGWSVRDVLAHCAAALTMAAAGAGHSFSPEDNQRDVDERKPWTIEALLEELSGGYAAAAAKMDAAGGRLDLLALGEWIHGGDVRDAWGVPDAYASAGLPDALALAELASRRPRLAVPETIAVLPQATLRLGTERADARIDTDAETFIRLIAGRSPDPARLRIAGADPIRFVLFH
jgi:uncharacterized protein (TIGR03083 family)